MSINTRIDRLEALLSAGQPVEISDRELAYSIWHHLTGLLVSGREHNEEDLQLLKTLVPDADPLETLERFRADYATQQAARAAARRSEFEEINGRGGGTFDDMARFLTPTAGPVVPRGDPPASPIGADGYYKPEYEAARVERITRTEPQRPQMAITTRGWGRL